MYSEDFTLIMNQVGILECGKHWYTEQGGYVNDKHDAGGETKWGISDRRDGVVDGMCDIDGDGVPEVVIKNLKKADAITIYYRNYWLPSGADGLPFALA